MCLWLPFVICLEAKVLPNNTPAVFLLGKCSPLSGCTSWKIWRPHPLSLRFPFFINLTNSSSPPTPLSSSDSGLSLLGWPGHLLMTTWLHGSKEKHWTITCVAQHLVMCKERGFGWVVARPLPRPGSCEILTRDLLGSCFCWLSLVCL